MDIKQIKSVKNVATVELTLPKKEIDSHREHVVDEMISQITVKGFRQGKAPKNIAVKELDPNKLTDHLLSHLLNEGVTEIMTKFHYRLLGRPVLQSIDTKNEENWIIKIDFPLYPEIKLGDYKKALPSQKKVAKPKKESPKEAPKDDRLQTIYQALLKNISVDIAPSVIDEEVSYSLDRLTQQAKNLNLTLESYLKAVNKPLEEVKKDYAQNAEESLKLDLILLAIAKEEKIESTDQEIATLAKTGQVPQNQLGQLRAILDRRKTIEFLSKI